jgi:N-acetylmuramoyl-L-alanine amidase
MKIAVDAGPGMGNRKPGVYDPGAVCEAYEEADIALQYGLTLKHLLTQQGVEVFMTRASHDEAAPVASRASRGSAAGCDCFVSFHLNSAESVGSGLEVLYRDDAKDESLASELQRKLVVVTRFRDRGTSKRTDLAVLKFRPGPAVLIEVGFINNPAERTFLLNRDNRIAICQAIMETITG